jgi:hypothetical protein
VSLPSVQTTPKPRLRKRIETANAPRGLGCWVNGTKNRVKDIGHLTPASDSSTVNNRAIFPEYPYGQPEWWYEIADGLPDPIVKKGFINVGRGCAVL